MNNIDHIIHASGLVKIYKVAELEVVALQGLDLEVARGEFLALVGPSGSGKSTLLSLIGGLDRPSAGQLVVDGLDLTTLTPTGLSAYRRDRVGFIWQQTTRNLLPYLSARENIELLMTFAGRGGRERRAWADELLKRLESRTKLRPRSRNCRVVSNSASPWRVRWRTDRVSCLATNRPVK
jgi:ABC-type lipoprotein export system ATPase subunit